MSTAIQPSTENLQGLADAFVARCLLELAPDHGTSLEKLSAGEIIEWGAEHLGTNLAVTMSMQDTVLAELAARHAPDADLIFLDTGYHFPETIEVADAVDKRYPNRLLRIQPVAGAVPELYKTDMTACCAQRKVEPLARMKLPYEGWVTGLKRVDAPTRKNTPVLEIDKTGRIKLNPLAAWTDDDVDRFIEDNDLIIHPLTKAGFPSIGCAPCTNRVAPGADPRSGRWAGAEKTECGLHT